MGRRYYGGFETEGTNILEPDYVWYNATIINNNQTDQTGGGLVLPDPRMQFNETRDKAIIDNSADYHFSIVRFEMNGSNLDLPLFIPQISTTPPYQVYTGASYKPLTVYSFTLSYQQMWNLPDVSATPTEISAASPETFMLWTPQFKNPATAPPPAIGPIEQLDMSSRYWWAVDYSYVVGLMNQTLLSAFQAVYTAFNTAWTASGTAIANPYADFQSFLNGVGIPPYLTYNQTDRSFSMVFDSSCFGQRLEAFTNFGTAGTPAYPPYCRAFMNNNMYGLLNGFSCIFWNESPVIPQYYTTFAFPTDPYTALVNVGGATQEFIVPNNAYQNVVDARLSPYAGTPPLGYVPTTPLNEQKVYWVVKQDFNCTDTLWSPIASIVFESTFLPITKEYVGAPTILGQGNLGYSQPVSQSAFQPIITDIALDQSQSGADAYRRFILYQPLAEYRFADTAGQQEIRNIDISVYWKSRLTGQYIPIQIWNLGTASIKCLFRKKTAVALKISH